MLAISPEANVLYSELLCTGGVDEASVFADEPWFGVFSASEEEVKADDGKVSDGLMVGVG